MRASALLRKRIRGALVQQEGFRTGGEIVLRTWQATGIEGSGTVIKGRAG